jgi:hypothetical protein
MKKVDPNITYNHLVDELPIPMTYNKATIALFIGEELLIIGLLTLMILMF